VPAVPENHLDQYRSLMICFFSPRRNEMAKYLLAASYTAEGLRGVIKNKASARKAAVEKLVAEAGGKLEAFYFAFGETDVFVLVDLPDAASAAALSMTVSASGLVKGKTIALLTVDEIDKALAKTLHYSAPGA
jgi:uncharacterized protein with GYD domain